MSAEIRALRRIQSSESFSRRMGPGGRINSSPRVISDSGDAEGRNAATNGWSNLQRHQSVKEPMMSMVPEEASSVNSGSNQNAANNSNNSNIGRSARTLSRIRPVGSVRSSSADDANTDKKPDHIISNGILKTFAREDAIFSRGNSVRNGGGGGSSTLPRNFGPSPQRHSPPAASPVKSDPPPFASQVSVLTTRQEGDGADYGNDEQVKNETKIIFTNQIINK